MATRKEIQVVAEKLEKLAAILIDAREAETAKNAERCLQSARVLVRLREQC